MVSGIPQMTARHEQRFIPQMEPLVSAEDAQAVNAYLASGGWLTEFTQTREFERSIREYTGARHCVAAPSGTMALFLALKACGIGRDEITELADGPRAAVRGIVGVDLKRISPRTGAGDDDATGRFSPASAAGELDAIRHFSFDGGSRGQCRAGRTFLTFSQLEPAAAR